MLARSPINYRRLTAAVCILSAFLLLMQTVDYINFAVDDVFIPLRIAQNVSSGYGFVYNKGDYVEGHSDPLWVAAIAGLDAFGVGSPDSPYVLLWVAKGLSYLFGLLCIVLTYRIIVRMLYLSPARRLYAALGMLALVMCSPFVLWACSGLEMTMVAFLYLVATYAAYKIFAAENTARSSSFVVIGIAFTLATLTRPEAPLFAAAAFTLLFFVGHQQRRKLILFAVIPYAVICGAFLLWRYTTYGDLLPSAFYAKTSNGFRSLLLGVKYCIGALGGISGPFILTLPIVLSRKEAFGKFRAFMLSLVGAAMVFSIYSSGDWMPAFRFLVLVAPVVVILAILSIRIVVLKLISETSFTCRQATLLASIALIASTNVFVMRELIRGNIGSIATGYTVVRGHTVVDHERVAHWLHERLKKNEVVAAGEAGIIGYLNPDMRLLDLNGLMDRKIAHDRKAGLPFDTDYIIKNEPDYIVLFGHIVVDTDAHTLPASGAYSTRLLDNPDFTKRYTRRAQFVSFDIYQKRKF